MSKLRILLGSIGTAVLVGAGGYSLIKEAEGVRYQAYADPAHGWAVPTICYGHTRNVKRGDTASKAQCDQYLKEDVALAKAGIDKLVKVPLSQGELDAYTSFVFNVGEPKFRNSTMLRLLNSGQRVAACNQLTRWVYAKDARTQQNIKLPGLVVRRNKEKQLCLSTL